MRIDAAPGLSLRVRGAVQGVGFRPHVWRLANESGLVGDVVNDGEGVFVRVWGKAGEIARFRQRLGAEAPPLARIDSIECRPLTAPSPHGDFRIGASSRGGGDTGIVPDAATCPACLAEIGEATQRRFGYAFTNCTHCGPRLSIIAGIPYDRSLTSMASFPLCPACRQEYENPADRRFHAQPIACPTCGPHLWLERADGKASNLADPLAEAAEMLRAGAILAIKGIGGFHLACDALNPDSVAELRRRKRRGDKPFALMMPNLATATAYVAFDADAAALLQSPAAPIVLLSPADNAAARGLAADAAPGQAEIGIMLPYSPLHHLLVQAVQRPLVMTSGNNRDEPQCIANEGARAGLAALADGFLMHDRDIVNRVDDSVLHIVGRRPRLLRRARGYAPEALPLPADFFAAPPVMGMGAELKNTFCLAHAGSAILSQHIGELGNAVTVADYRKSLALYREIYQFSPKAIAVDLHPDYAATRIGGEISAELGIPLVGVQHHHAHIAACMVEHGVALADGPVLGIVLDGLGLGDDGAIWGGEFMLCTYRDFKRLGRFAPVALPGGDLANRQPWRNAYAHLHHFVGTGDLPRLPVFEALAQRDLAVLDRMMERGINAPPASSAGRLFDAVAAVLGIAPPVLSFEGEAAQKLEALALMESTDVGIYAYELHRSDLAELNWRPLWTGILGDIAGQTRREVIARKFHNTLVVAVADLATHLVDGMDTRTVAVSGGVFHNRLILEGVTQRLRAHACRVLVHERVPSGDGGLSLGQAAVALARAGNGLATR